MTEDTYYLPHREGAVTIEQDDLKEIANLYRDGFERVEFTDESLGWDGPKATSRLYTTHGTFVISYIPRQSTVALLAGDTGYKSKDRCMSEVLVSFDETHTMEDTSLKTLTKLLVTKWTQQMVKDAEDLADEFSYV